MSLKYNVVVNAATVTEPGQKTFKYGEQTYNLTYEQILLRLVNTSTSMDIKTHKIQNVSSGKLS